MHAASIDPQKCGSRHKLATSTQAVEGLRRDFASRAVGVCAYPFLDRLPEAFTRLTSAVTMHRSGG